MDTTTNNILFEKQVGSLPIPFIDRMRRPILFRKVTQEDKARVMKMYHDFEPKGVFQGLPPADPERLEIWVNHMLDTGFNIVGLSFEQKAACHGAIFDIDGNRSDFIVVVSHVYQNAGIGMQLTRLIKKISLEMGYGKIWLCVEPYNQKAKHIYQKLGFHFTYTHDFDECEMLVDLKSDPSMQVPVEDIMTRDVICLREDQTAKDAIKMFLNVGISGLPVVNSAHCLVGFLTETDLLESWAGERSLYEIMTRNVLYVNKDTALSEIVILIGDRGVKQIPVVQKKDNYLLGIVSRKDILRRLYLRYV